MGSDKLTDSALVELIKGNINNYEKMGSFVRFREDISDTYSSNEISDEEAYDIVSKCRRKIKKNDILIFIEYEIYNEDYDEEDDDEEDEFYKVGIVFTKNKLCEISDRGITKTIEYTQIEDADYDCCGVTITANGERHYIECCNDFGRYDDTYKEYPKYMYNFIMDIVDYLQEDA